MVSIITPAYNAARYLPATIESVIAQTYRDWEMIIVNDSSVDNTSAIVREYMEKDKRIKLVEAPENKGAAVARNLGVHQATGEYIAFIDSDDLWKKDKLAVQLERMQVAGALFSFTSFNIIAGEKTLRPVEAPAEVGYLDLLKGCNIGCSTVMYNAQALGKQYFYPASPTAREDYVLWLHIAREMMKNTRMLGIKEPLVDYRKHDGGISSRKSRAAWNQWLVYRQVEKLSFLASMYYFTHYAINAFKKHYL